MRQILSRLVESRHRTLPSMILPPNVQWRLMDLISDTQSASTVLDRPEFSPAVKFQVRERASLESRTAWMSSDPPISDGDFLLETLRIAQHPRSGLASVHLLGNRPSLSRAVVELGLVPLFPAAARHTRTLEDHGALIDALAGCDDDPVVRKAVELFCGRTDVSWVLRTRVHKYFSTGRPHPYPDLATITESWDAVGLGEAGSTDGLRHVLPSVARTRRAAAQILARGAGLPPEVVSPARTTARRAIASTITQQMAEGCSRVEPVPPELVVIIDTRPLLPAVTGETSPARTRSIAPQSVGRPAGIEAVERADGSTYRATPGGSVVRVTSSSS